eukprot:12364523-Heterocapsa_arctica.AAC.1
MHMCECGPALLQRRPANLLDGRRHARLDDVDHARDPHDYAGAVEDLVERQAEGRALAVGR